MIMSGKNVTQLNDNLTEVSIERLYKGIINPNGPLATQISQLRSLKLIDENQYRRVKTQLPYVVAGIFSPSVRRKENFRYTNYFIIDIDHISAFGHTVDEVKQILNKNPQVLLLFTSPGGDGVKAFFSFNEKMDDPSQYSYFYKLFAASLAGQYHWQGMIDGKTCDVSRCCFVSHDTQAYYNKEAEQINAIEFLGTLDDTGMFGMDEKIKMAENDYLKAFEDKPETTDITAATHLPSEDVLLQIKQRLNPFMVVRPPRHFEQPAQLEQLFAGIPDYLKEAGVEIKRMSPISYGRQIQVVSEKLMAEINIFYGKKGFSVVKTTKTGSNPQLASL